MSTPTEHMKPGIVFPTEGTWIRRRVAFFGGESPLRAVDIPIIGQFGNPCTEGVRGLYRVRPETCTGETQGGPYGWFAAELPGRISGQKVRLMLRLLNACEGGGE